MLGMTGHGDALDLARTTRRLPCPSLPRLASRDGVVLGGAAASGLAAALGVRPVRAAGTIEQDAKSALIVVDVQNCFVDGGTVPVKGGAVRDPPGD